MEYKKPDYAYWARLGYWRCQPTALLFLGICPEWTHENAGVVYKNPEVKKMCRIFETSGLFDGFDEKASPECVVRYAIQKKIQIPTELTPFFEEATPVQNNNAVVTIEAGLKENNRELLAENRTLRKQLDDTKANTIHEKERVNAAKIILCMAMAAYQHDPYAMRSGTAKAIQTDMDTYGVSLDADTIRKWLKEGKEALPDIRII